MSTWKKEEMRLWMQKERQKRIASKFCYYCGSRPVTKYKGCEVCRNKISKSAKGWISKNPEKYSAQTKLRYAVKIERVIKPEFCSECGESKPLHGHHTNYAEPLRVVWLCGSCHRLTHNRC